METIVEAASAISTFADQPQPLASLPATIPGEHRSADVNSSVVPSAGSGIPLKSAWDRYSKFPIDLSVSFPLEEITLSHLAELRPGMVLRSPWPAAEDIPLLTGDVFLANVSFEPVGTRLGIRLSGFAPRPVPATKRPVMAEAEQEESAAPQTSDTLKDLWLNLSVCVGTMQMTVEEILQWAIGDTIPLDRPVNAPVNVLLKERIVASGNLVLVAGFYAVQLTGIAPRSRRLPQC